MALAFSIIGAAAANGARLTTESETVVLDGVTSATAECDGARKAVSGGFAPSSLGVTVSGSSKAGKREWTAEGVGFKSELTVYAYCSRKGKNPTTESTDTTVPPDAIRATTARCEPGQKAVSGGFFGQNGFLISPDVRVHQSQKTSARGWTVAGGNAGPVDGELIAYVNCRGGKGLRARSRTTTVAGATGMQADPSASLIAKCKRGERAISGGFAAGVDGSYLADPDSGAGVTPSLSRRAGGRKWEAGAVNFGGESGTLTSYVYCERKPKKK